MSQNNVRLHIAAHTVESRQQQNFDLLKQPAYIPDLTSCDCRLSGPVKDVLRGGHLASDQVKEAVREWLLTQPETIS